MTPALSAKFRNLTFLAIVCVLFIHAWNWYPRELQPSTRLFHPLPVTVAEYVVANGLTRWVIPLLFLISGFLYFRSKGPFAEPYGEKFLKRLRTVVLPWQLWNLIAIGTFFLLLLSPWITAHAPPWLMQFTLQNWIDSLLFYPFNFPLWYLRDLFVLSMAAPLLGRWLGSRRAAPWALAGLGALWLSGWDIRGFGFESWFWFSLGGWLALRGSPLEFKAPVCLTWLLTGIWLTAAAFQVWAAAAPAPDWVIGCLYRLVQVLGLAAVWLLYDLFSKGSSRLWPGAGLSFYVFAGHIPLMILLMDPLLWLKIWPNPETALLTVYLLLPTALLAFWLTLGWLLRRYLPPVHRVLTGFRD